MKTIYEYDVDGIRVYRVQRDGQKMAFNQKMVVERMKNLVVTRPG